MPGGTYGFPNQLILTNSTALGNSNSAIILRHPPMENIKPYYDCPPPPYELGVGCDSTTSIPPQFQARQPTAPPEYNDLDILPGAIPTQNIILYEPLSRVQSNVLPQKR